MSLIIDPKSASVSKKIQDLQNFLDSKPNADVFAPFFTSATGKAIIELIAGSGATLDYNNIVGRRENFIQFAKNRSSLVGGSQNLGVSVPRGSNRHLTLTVTPDQTTVLPRFSVIGSVRDKDIVLLADTPINNGVQTTLEVVVGDFGSESITVGTDGIARFRYVTPDMSEDLRITLNGTEVPISSNLEDMQRDFYAVLTNPFGAVDVFSLNQESSANRYATGDILTAEFILLEDFTFTINDMGFNFGELNSFITSESFINREADAQIVVNSPLKHETQQRIRGRLDFQKNFLGLDTRIVDTAQRDVSPARVELTYVRSDNLLFTATEKSAFVDELMEGVIMGIEPPPMVDPILVPLKLAFTLTLLSEDGDPINAVQNVVALQEKILQKQLNLLNIESQVEKSETSEDSGIRFVETARVVIDSDTWQAATGYRQGQYVNPTTENGLIYEMSKIIYRTGETQPNFPETVGETIVDGDIIWETQLVDLCVQLFTWTATTPKDIGSYVVPTVPNGFMYRAVNFINRTFGNEEIQKIEFDAVPNSGTFRIHFGSEKTIDLTFAATATDIENALRDLDALSDVEVIGNFVDGFTLTFTGDDANKQQPEVDFTDPGADEVQLVAFSAIPNGGNWGLEFDGQQTSLLTTSSSAADVKAALEALSNIDTVNVTGDFANGFTITFTGVNAKTDVPLLIQYVTSDSGTDEIQELQFSAVPDAGTFRLHFGDEFTANMPFNATASLVQSELNGLDALDGVLVAGDFVSNFVITFAGDSGKQNQPLIEVNNPGRNEIQTLLFSTTPDQGTFRLELSGEETADIPYNSTTAQIESFITALAGVSSVSVSGDFVSGLQIEFTGADGNEPKNLFDLSDPGTDEVQRLDFSSVPTSGDFSLTFDGQTTNAINYTNGTNEVQKVEFSIVPDSGDFTLVFEAQQTAAIAFNATALTVKSALEALPNIDLVSVSGDFASGFEVEFLGINQNKDVSQMTVGANTLQASTVPVTVTFSTLTEGEENTAQVIENELEALSNIDAVNVVGDFSSGFEITFVGDLVAKKDVNQLVVATNNLLDGLSSVSITPSTTTQGQFPAQNVKRLGEDVVITVQRDQGGLIPANQLTNSGSGVTITPLESTTGSSPVSNLDRNGNPVSVTVTEETKGEVPASNLFDGATPVTITPTTIVDAAEAEPTWPTTLGETVIDGDIVWVMVEFNGTPDVWQPDTNYNKGEFVQPSTTVEDPSGPTQLMAQVLGFVGTSSTVEPSFPTTEGSTVIENNIEWRAQNPAKNPPALAFNEYYEITQTVTVS